jgi:hypothetical protein
MGQKKSQKALTRLLMARRDYKPRKGLFPEMQVAGNPVLTKTSTNLKKGNAMNPHIEVVKKWLEDPKSLNLKELQDNFSAANDTFSANDTDATYAADVASAYASSAASDAVKAAHWVKKYEELTSE